MKEMLVAIVLPMYNEEQSIAPLREMFDRALPLPPGCEYRIIAVNDGSSDATLKLATRWARENWRVSVLSHDRNWGLGQAILTGFGEAIRTGAQCIVTMDADASHPGNVIRHLVEAVISGADISIASRFAPGGRQIGVSLPRRLFSLGARLALGTIFPLRGVRDYTVGFRAYRTTLVNEALSKEETPFLAFRTFTAMAEILLKMAPLACQIVEVPLVLRYDLKQSPSKLKLAATLLDYAKLSRMPKQNGPLGRGLEI